MVYITSCEVDCVAAHKTVIPRQDRRTHVMTESKVLSKVHLIPVETLHRRGTKKNVAVTCPASAKFAFPKLVDAS
eukprot:3894790-Amphidinium_carterae.1